MKTLLPLLLCALSFVPLAAQAATPATADADYAAFQALRQEKPPGSPEEVGAEKFLSWLDGIWQAQWAAARAFLAAHPTDPRRWDAVLAALTAPPIFITGFGPDVATKGPAAIIPDAVAVTTAQLQAEELIKSMLASTDAPPALRENAEWVLFVRDFRATSAAQAKGEPHDFSSFRARFEAHVAKYAELDAVAARAADYLGALEHNLPGATAEIWRHLKDAPNAALRALAAKRLNFFELLGKPLEMAFTAADGRPVDLKNLRGKVVLIDFWATWCGPCIAELPNIKKVYAAYHGKGFEIVGISLENGKLTTKDMPEQVVAKLEAAKKVLTNFTTKEEMSWPQHFDGKYWQNEFAVKYGIQSIPAMFLIDQDGKLVTTEARGEKLEQEVKRLLNL